MAYLDPLLPTKKCKPPLNNIPVVSRADELIKHSVTIEVSKVLFIGKLPDSLADALIQRVLRCCGTIESWKRSTSHDGKLQKFGFCTFEDEKAVILCMEYLNNLELAESTLLVKSS